MKRRSSLILTVGLVAGCGDPSSADVDDSASPTTTVEESDDTRGGDGDGDTGDGDGEPGDSDAADDDGDTGEGETGDGDGDTEDDDFEPIPDGLFAEIPGFLHGTLVLGPDHAFAKTFDGVVKISKKDASYEIYTTNAINNLARNGNHLYASGSTTISRASFDDDSSLEVIGSLSGAGGLNEIVFTTSHLFVRRDFANDGIYRFNHDGGSGTPLALLGVGRIEAGGDRLFGTVNGNLVEFDTQTGAQTLVFESVTQFHVGADRLFIWLDGALRSSSFSGDQLTELTADFGDPSYVLPQAADEEHLYWVDNHGGAKIGRVPIGGGEIELLHTNRGNATATALRLDATHVYWVSSPGIWRYTK